MADMALAGALLVAGAGLLVAAGWLWLSTRTKFGGLSASRGPSPALDHARLRVVIAVVALVLGAVIAAASYLSAPAAPPPSPPPEGPPQLSPQNIVALGGGPPLGFVLLLIVTFVVLVAFIVAALWFSRASVAAVRKVQATRVQGLRYAWTAVLPQQVHEGDSVVGTVRVTPRDRAAAPGARSAVVIDATSGHSLSFDLPTGKPQDYELELEVQAAGVGVDGAKAQRQPLAARELTYEWNLFFENSGDFTLNVVVRLVGQGGQAVRVGSFPAKVRVVQFFEFTKRQTQAVTYTVAVLGGIATTIAAWLRFKPGV